MQNTPSPYKATESESLANGTRPSVWPWSLGTGCLGAMLGILAVVVLIFLNIPGSLSTGIRTIDSMLYSLGGISAAVIVALLWAGCGGMIGLVAGTIIGLIRRNAS